MSTCINASSYEKQRRKPRRARRPIGLEALRGKDRPTAWLRSLISSIDFGVKIRTIGPKMEPISKPVHCNTNAEIVDAFRLGDWDRIERLSNWKLEAHWDNRATYYYVADGSTKNRYILVNIDIDCHASGSERGAAEAAEYFKANFFTDLYHEPSTNGRGRHGYFILDKSDLGAETVKTLLKDLERRLNGHLLAQGFDIELCEIKGLPPVVTWGEDDTISNYTAGILAKIPRQVNRFEEWKRTTVLHEFGLRRLITTLRSLTPTAASTEEVTTQPESKSSRAKPKISGSVSGRLIGDEELAQLAEDGHYRAVATTLMESHALKTSGRSVVTAEDVAIFLICLRFFTGRMNADGSLPVRRFEGLWTGLYEAGDVGRAFDCHRFKRIRDYLSDLGLIDWQDHTYVVPRFDESGMLKKGRACKWKAGEQLMEMLDWEKREEAARDADVGVEPVDGEGAERAPFVGTDYEVASTGNYEGRRGGAPFVGTDESSHRSAPDPIEQMIQSLRFVPDELRIRPVEYDGSKPWHLFPDDVTRLIPDFEESTRLLAA